MASTLTVYDTGYHDDRFEQMVSQTLHCIICTNVIKDPVMCRHNEHLFCRACITKHLKNYQTCPSCKDPLTLDTLSKAPRGIKDLLNELKIRCEFFDRGCGKFIQLGNLEGHVRECGFAPAVCSNEGCELQVNKQDLLHHETAVCEQRKVKCHSCNDIRKEMHKVKNNLAAINEKLDRNETNIKTTEVNLVAKVELLQQQLYMQQESNCRLENDNLEMKKSLIEITKQLETQQTSHQVQAELKQVKEGAAEPSMLDGSAMVVIAGGENDTEELNSVEMFSFSNGTWTQLNSMRESRSEASSVVKNNQFIISGGLVKSMEKLSLNSVQADQPITWENCHAKLPGRLYGHRSVVHNGRLIVIGGYDADKRASSDSITEIYLVPPYTSKVLATMRKRKYYHGVLLFGNMMVIVGGRQSGSDKSSLSTVLLYDITLNEFKELAPLPYSVSEMATVKWGDDNVLIMGGADSDNEPLSTVLMYNIKTQKSYMLPDMKYKREGCVAAVVRDTVIVMGGLDERGNCLKSVESFRFDRYTWEELPEMHQARVSATAAVW